MKNFFSGVATAVKSITLSGILDAVNAFFDIMFLYGGFAIIAIALLFDLPDGMAIVGAFWMLIGLWTRQIKLSREIQTVRTLIGHITVVLATSEILLGLHKDIEKDKARTSSDKN